MAEEKNIKKVIIPIAGLGTRFLPLSLAVSKEFFPLGTAPVIQHIFDEMRKSGIEEVVFVVNPKQKMIMNYFKKSPELEEFLIKRKKDHLVKELKDFESSFEGMRISYALQKDPMGDGHAILQAAKLLKEKYVAVSFGDDVVYSEVPAILQLIEVFKTCNAPVIALKTMSKEKISAYGSVAVEKIANRLYKIKKIIEKPEPSQIQSSLVTVGRSVLTPDVFDYLKKAEPSAKGEIILAETFEKMISDGFPVYGYELKGEWLECGDKLKWLKSFLYISLKDPKFGKELRDYVRPLAK